MSEANEMDKRFADALNIFKRKHEYKDGDTFESFAERLPPHPTYSKATAAENLLRGFFQAVLKRNPPSGPAIADLIVNEPGNAVKRSEKEWFFYILEAFKKGDTLKGLLEYIQTDIAKEPVKAVKAVDAVEGVEAVEAITQEQRKAIEELDNTIWDIPSSLLRFNFPNPSYLQSLCNSLVRNDATLKKTIDSYCYYIISLHKILPSLRPISEVYLEDLKKKCLFGQPINLQNGYCKTTSYLDEKATLCTFLVKILVRIFEVVKISNPVLLNDKDSYIGNLFKAVELFCHTFGFEHSDTITQYTNELITKLNDCFPTPVIYERCSGSGDYGCGRMLLQVIPEPAPASDKRKIVLISQDNYGRSMERNRSVNVDIIKGSLSGPPIRKAGGSRKKNRRLKRRTIKGIRVRQ